MQAALWLPSWSLKWMLASALGLFCLRLVLLVGHSSANPHYLAEADKTLESDLIPNGIEISGCAVMVPTTPIPSPFESLFG